MKKKELARHKMSDLYYGGRHIDFWFVADKESGEPTHEICGFALISRITGKHKTIGTSKTYVQQLKLFWEDVILWNNLDWREVTDEEITLYLFEHRFKQQKLSGKSIQVQLTAILEFYAWWQAPSILDT